MRLPKSVEAVKLEFEKLPGIGPKTAINLIKKYGSFLKVYENIKEIPVTLTSHADEITFLIKKDSKVLFPLCNTRPFSEYGFMHHEGKILGFRGEGDERVFREVGTAELHQKEKKPVDKKKSQEKKFEYFLQNIKGDEQREGDLVVPNYNLTQKNYGLKTIFHSKALDDRVGVLSDIYTVKELARAGIPSKAILVGDEEGVDSELAWARLARPSFARYCRPDGITILCDGFDGKKLYEFSEFDGKHLEAGLIAPYRSEGKGAGDPGLFSLLRDEVIPLAKKHGFEAVTTTDYVSRSLDPKIMDDFPFICSIDWSNGPVMTPTFVKDNPALSYFNVCHVDESVAISQVLNIIGTTFWSACFLHKKMVQP